MKFSPLHDRIVVRRIEESTKTAGGIIIPEGGANEVALDVLVRFINSVLAAE
jgi:co-chaperonin GroES (HSP10)